MEFIWWVVRTRQLSCARSPSTLTHTAHTHLCTLNCRQSNSRLDDQGAQHGHPLRWRGDRRGGSYVIGDSRGNVRFGELAAYG
jgi:hypothetical protein